MGPDQWMPFFVPFLWIGVVTAIVLVSITQRRRILPARQSAAERLGLQYREGPFGARGRIEGHAKHGRMEIRFIGGKGAHTIYAATGAEQSIEVGPEGFAASFGKVFRGADIEVGDPAFDRAVVIRGDEAWLVAHLDAERRAALVRLMGRTRAPSLDGGTAKLRRPGIASSESEIVADASALLELVDVLHADGGDLVPKLARNAASDPLAAVRIRNLRLLLERWRADSRADKALEKALEDPEAEVRLGAAAFASVARRAEIARAIADDPSGRMPMRMRALRMLAETDPAAAQDRVPLLLRLLEKETVNDDAIAALAACGGAEAVEPLRKLGGAKAREAIARIQARLPGAEHGQLSVTEDGGGKLSLAQVRGALSEPKKT